MATPKGRSASLVLRRPFYESRGPNEPQQQLAPGVHPTVTPLLTRRPRAGDRSFERMYQKHVHAVYRYALAVLHNEADAEDVTQQTFLSAYGAFQRGERPRKA